MQPLTERREQLRDRCLSAAHRPHRGANGQRVRRRAPHPHAGRRRSRARPQLCHGRRRDARQRGPWVRPAPHLAPRRALRPPARPARSLYSSVSQHVERNDGPRFPGDRRAAGPHRWRHPRRGGRFWQNARPRLGHLRTVCRSGGDHRRRCLPTLRYLRFPAGPDGANGPRTGAPVCRAGGVRPCARGPTAAVAPGHPHPV